MSAEFADTNVVLYLLDDGPKADRAEFILGQGPRISVQVLNETAQDWVPHVRRLRPDLAWEDVVRIVNGPLPRERQWTQSRLLRAVNAYVRDGFLPPTVLDRAGRRETDDRLPAIVAAIKGADPDITLQAICTRLEAMRERTPRGRTSWQPSSVKMLLERAERLGLLE